MDPSRRTPMPVFKVEVCATIPHRALISRGGRAKG
jgi:hypothetical protein